MKAFLLCLACAEEWKHGKNTGNLHPALRVAQVLEAKHKIPYSF
jgi:hypothetical protein